MVSKVINKDFLIKVVNDYLQKNNKPLLDVEKIHQFIPAILELFKNEIAEMEEKEI